MSDHDVTLHYSALDQDSMMVGTALADSENFDVRCQFQIQHKGSTAHNTIYFGLLGLANQVLGVVSDCVMLRVQRGNFAGNVRLLKVRGGNMAGSAVLASAQYNLKVNTRYWMRLVCSGGHFTAYISKNKNWGNPLFTYQWSDADYPCPIGTVPGKGQCGIYGRITPLRFKSTALDDCSTVIPVSELHDLGSFPSSGKVFWAGEYCSFSGKSGNTFGNMNILTSSIDSKQSDIANMWYNHILGIYQTMIMCNNAQDFTGYACQWDSGNEINAAWRISSCNNIVGGVQFSAQFDDSGHANTNYIQEGHPLWHETSASELETGSGQWAATDPGVCFVRPAITGVVRGQNGTTPVGHTADFVYLYEEDEIQVFAYETYDHAEDLSTEDLLHMASWLAGVESEFVTYDDGTQVVSCGGAAWGTPVDLTNNGQANIDIRMHAELADGQSLGVGFRYDPDQNKNCFIASFERVGDYYYACVYDSNLVLWDKHRFEQVSGGVLELRVCSCIRVAGDPGTFISLYLNKMVYTAYVEAYAPQHGAQAAFLVGRGADTITVTYTIPEFGDWREAVYLDPNSDAQGALSMIIQERVCKIVSRSGEKLKFSAWDRYGDPVVILNNVIVQDDFSQEDSEMFSYMHVESDNIKEAINPDLMATEGVLIKSFSMPRLIDDQARSAASRQLRLTEETSNSRSILAPADPRLENEDKIQVGYTAVGSIITIPNSFHIITDIAYSLGPALFDMKIGVRKWVDDVVR